MKPWMKKEVLQLNSCGPCLCFFFEGGGALQKLHQVSNIFTDTHVKSNFNTTKQVLISAEAQDAHHSGRILGGAESLG